MKSASGKVAIFVICSLLVLSLIASTASAAVNTEDIIAVNAHGLVTTQDDRIMDNYASITVSGDNWYGIYAEYEAGAIGNLIDPDDPSQVGYIETWGVGSHGMVTKYLVITQHLARNRKGTGRVY